MYLIENHIGGIVLEKPHKTSEISEVFLFFLEKEKNNPAF